MMCWQKIVFIVWALYVIAANIATINKPKTPTKPPAMAFAVIVWILIMAMVISI